MRIEHIGIAVKNLEESLAEWGKLFHFKHGGEEEIRERGVKVAYLEIEEGPSIELVAPCGDESPLEQFLQERGEGIHHFCFEVEDIRKTMKEFTKRGIRFIHEEPQRGAAGSLIAFIHPKSFNDVLIELKEKK